MYEGVYYVLATGLLSLALGIGCSLLIVKPLSNVVWFANYHFMLAPILVLLPILLIIGIIIPWVAHKHLNKQSVVERLREA
jgi:putative ABC transport system permease protein